MDPAQSENRAPQLRSHHWHGFPYENTKPMTFRVSVQGLGFEV